MKFIGMVFSAARAWLQAMTPTAATQTIRNIIVILKVRSAGTFPPISLLRIIRTTCASAVTSGLPQRPDIRGPRRHVSKVPQPTFTTRSVERGSRHDPALRVPIEIKIDQMA